MAKASMNLGVYAGILNPKKEGKLLLRRRVEEDSIIPGKSFRGNWELPGGGVMETEKPGYDWLVRELKREVEEEVGISIPVDLMPPMYSLFFRGPLGDDLAQVTPIIAEVEPAKGETRWVSPTELESLAEEFVPANKKAGIEGKGIVSGYGKRMHCMALASLCHSPNPKYAKQATEMLREIQEGW